jgi:hypothetical protein
LLAVFGLMLLCSSFDLVSVYLALSCRVCVCMFWLLSTENLLTQLRLG